MNNKQPMPEDIIRSSPHIKETIATAKRMGFPTSIIARTPKEKRHDITGVLHAIICTTPKEIHQSKGKSDLIIFSGSEDIRKAIEAGPDIICDTETASRKDFIHHRHSGLNQVTIQIAKEKGVTVGIAFSTLLHSKNRHILFGRIRQNIRLCRKYKVPLRIFTLAQQPLDTRSPADLISFLEEMGMHPSEAQAAVR